MQRNMLSMIREFMLTTIKLSWYNSTIVLRKVGIDFIATGLS